MAEPQQPEQSRGGIVAWFAGHHVAANLLMLFVLLVGLMSLGSIIVEVFPEFEVNVLSVSVVYPGASPAETEQGVVLRIEEAIASIEDIDRITATAAEGAGSVSIELAEGADSRKVLDDRCAHAATQRRRPPFASASASCGPHARYMRSCAAPA